LYVVVTFLALLEILESSVHSSISQSTLTCMRTVDMGDLQLVQILLSYPAFSLQDNPCTYATNSIFFTPYPS